MTDTLERTDLDVVLTEEPVEGDKCEADGEHPCTVTAVAFGKPTCLPGSPILVCKWIVDWASGGMARGGRCGDCKRSLTECWVLTPI